MLMTTHLILIQTKKSLLLVMGIPSWFNKISGLGINKDKKKVVKIVASRERSISWEGEFGLDWTHSLDDLAPIITSRS